MGRKRTRKPKLSKYQFNISDVIIYMGRLYEQYNNTEGLIVDRNYKKKQEFYKIKFKDDKIFEITVKVLRLKE